MPVNDFVIKNEAAALRLRADALIVLVITPKSVFYSEDPKMPPAEIQRVLQEEAPGIAQDARKRRAKGGNR